MKVFDYTREEAKMLSSAIFLANEVHSGQVDKLGQPYILHPMRVAARGETPAEVIVGLLHDVVEDGEVNMIELKSMFNEEIAVSVMLLTRKPGTSYDEYVDRLVASADVVALRVKLNDLKDNTDPARTSAMAAVDPELFTRFVLKYAKTRTKVEAALAKIGGNR